MASDMLDPGAILLLLLAAVLQAVMSTIIKRGEDLLATTAMMAATAALASALVLPFVPPPAPASWPYLALSCLVQACYYPLLSQTYRVGDLNQTYPIMRATALILVALSGVVFAGEALGPWRIACLAIVIAGIVLLTTRPRALSGATAALPGPGRPRALPIVLAFATGVMVAGYLVVDGLGVRLAASPLGYTAWALIVGAPPAIAMAAFKRRRALGPALARNWRGGAAAGLLLTICYALILYVLQSGPCAVVSAVREIGIVLTALSGTLVLAEPLGRRRIVASVIVATGIILMNFGR